MSLFHQKKKVREACSCTGKNLCIVALTLGLILFFLSSFDQLACLGELCSLSELTLDGNPIALETWYKQAVLCCVLHLRQLDMKRVTVRLLKRCLCVFTRGKKLIPDQSLQLVDMAVKFIAFQIYIYCIYLISTNLGQ